MSDNKFYIVVNGERVPVSEQVYKEYHHYQRKEEYFTYDLKAERFISDQETQTAVFIPGREDSYDRLLELDKQFPSDEEAAEDAAMKSIMLKRLVKVLDTLDADERRIIHELFYLDRTVRQASIDLNIARSTLQDRKNAITSER